MVSGLGEECTSGGYRTGLSAAETGTAKKIQVNNGQLKLIRV